jgi:hypothetical protein
VGYPSATSSGSSSPGDRRMVVVRDSVLMQVHVKRVGRACKAGPTRRAWMSQQPWQSALESPRRPCAEPSRGCSRLIRSRSWIASSWTRPRAPGCRSIEWPLLVFLTCPKGHPVSSRVWRSRTRWDSRRDLMGHTRGPDRPPSSPDIQFLDFSSFKNQRRVGKLAERLASAIGRRSVERLSRWLASLPRRSNAQRIRTRHRSGTRGLPYDHRRPVTLAVALFADALARGDLQLANDAAGIALDLTAQVRYAMGRSRRPRPRECRPGRPRRGAGVQGQRHPPPRATASSRTAARRGC